MPTMATTTISSISVNPALRFRLIIGWFLCGLCPLRRLRRSAGPALYLELLDMRQQPACSLFKPGRHLCCPFQGVTVQGQFQFSHEVIKRMAIGLDVGELGPECTDHVFETLSFLPKIIMVSDFRLDHQITLADRFEDIAKSIQWPGDAMGEED